MTWWVNYSIMKVRKERGARMNTMEALEKAKEEYKQKPTPENEVSLVALHELYSKEYWEEDQIDKE